MTGKCWAKSRDGNELAIVEALRARGVSVTRIESSLDPGVFDLLCEVEQYLASGARLGMEWILLEVKDMSAKAPGGKQCVKASELAPGGDYEAVLDHCDPKVARKLRRDQADFLLRHKAPRYVVTSVEEAIRACGFEPCSRCGGTGRIPHLYEDMADAPCPRCEECCGLDPETNDPV